MKKYILPLSLFILATIFSTLIWELIKIPFDISKQITGESYLKNLHHPLNDSLRFIAFLSIPFLTLISFYQITEKKFFKNTKYILRYDFNDINLKYHLLNKFFYIFLILVLFEFFTLDFNSYNYHIDIFHEGLWLSASQNSKFSDQFLESSYITRGFFGNFHPYFIWKILGIESIGSIRFFHLTIILLNKILLLLIAKKITEMVDLKIDFKLIFFSLLSLIFLFFTSYGEPIFIIRSFLLLFYILILLNFFTNYKSRKFIIILGLTTSLSIFWFIDISAYINLITLILAIFFLIRSEFKNLLLLIISTITIWTLCFFVFPLGFDAFIANTLSVISTIEYIQGLIYPTPFSGDFRSTRALMMFLVSGALIIYLIKDLNHNNLHFILSAIFLFLIGLIHFKYGLSRSDSAHIKIGQSFAYLPFFAVLIFIILRNLRKKINLNFYLSSLLIILFLIFINIEKKYENKNIFNVISSFSSINKLLSYEDNVYLDKDYNNFVIYYKNLTDIDKCVTIFTHETALIYFLKKPSCSKFYKMYTASPRNIQNQIIEDIDLKKPTFIVYNSNKDLYGSNRDNLELVNKFITSNYQFYEKFKNWEIYKIKK